jgi:hypothetical protein
MGVPNIYIKKCTRTGKLISKKCAPQKVVSNLLQQTCRKVMSTWYGTHCLYLNRRLVPCITEIHFFNVRWSVHMTSSSVCWGTATMLLSLWWTFKLFKLSMCIYSYTDTHTKCSTLTNTHILCSQYKTTKYQTNYVHLTYRSQTLTCL